MSICPVCAMTYSGAQQFCNKCGARLHPKDKPVMIEWLAPRRFRDY